uniref:Predicted protein n=1 Tax=Hordeum vulgare subsp. vulgare TaxID=112509 RepID=F2DEV4_HORVV|nr:predicted protein [Hordeum vulgare subsp. vulgare]
MSVAELYQQMLEGRSLVPNPTSTGAASSDQLVRWALGIQRG